MFYTHTAQRWNLSVSGEKRLASKNPSYISDPDVQYFRSSLAS